MDCKVYWIRDKFLDARIDEAKAEDFFIAESDEEAARRFDASFQNHPFPKDFELVRVCEDLASHTELKVIETKPRLDERDTVIANLMKQIENLKKASILNIEKYVTDIATRVAQNVMRQS